MHSLRLIHIYATASRHLRVGGHVQLDDPIHVLLVVLGELDRLTVVFLRFLEGFGRDAKHGLARLVFHLGLDVLLRLRVQVLEHLIAQDVVAGVDFVRAPVD